MQIEKLWHSNIDIILTLSGLTGLRWKAHSWKTGAYFLIQVAWITLTFNYRKGRR